MTTNAFDTPSASARDCVAAVAIALQAIADRRFTGGPFKLVEAMNLLTGSWPVVGPQIWRIGFKPQRLIPPAAGEIVGAGGEVWFQVDLATGQAQLMGLGE